MSGSSRELSYHDSARNPVAFVLSFVGAEVGPERSRIRMLRGVSRANHSVDGDCRNLDQRYTGDWEAAEAPLRGFGRYEHRILLENTLPKLKSPR